MKRNRIFRALLAACLMLALAGQVFAAGNIDTEKDVKLTISYRDGETPLRGAYFAIYKIAEADYTGALHLIAPYDEADDIDIDIFGKSDETDEAWVKLASTLEVYVQRERIDPTDKGRTDTDGSLTFPTSSDVTMKPGLYLVIGNRHTQGGYYYDPQPFLVMLPTIDVEENVWDYDVEVSEKFSKRRIPSTPGEGEEEFQKVWNDGGASKTRPASITVDLLRNGEVYDTVTLTAKDNWRYTWKHLDSRYRYLVSERVPEGYKMTASRDGDTIVVTNTGEKPPKDYDDRLPQTGLVWWPVELLAIGGVACLLLAGILKKRERDG